MSKRARPPNTPPTIAPTGVFKLSWGVVAEVDGVDIVWVNVFGIDAVRVIAVSVGTGAEMMGVEGGGAFGSTTWISKRSMVICELLLGKRGSGWFRRIISCTAGVGNCLEKSNTYRKLSKGNDAKRELCDPPGDLYRHPWYSQRQSFRNFDHWDHSRHRCRISHPSTLEYRSNKMQQLAQENPKCKISRRNTTNLIATLTNVMLALRSLEELNVPVCPILEAFQVPCWNQEP